MKTCLFAYGVTLACIALQGSMFAQCCDPDSFEFLGFGPCSGDNNWVSDGGVCDPDCGDYSVCDAGSECYDPNDSTCTIPLDGGLSLLALAGGGLATAAIRRRREEEVRQADES